MFQNYFKIALRQFRKQKMYTVVKTGGFALGIAACLLIALYIKEELSYDKQYPDAAHIYRLVGWVNDKGATQKMVDFPAPLVAAVKKDFPEVEKAGRLMYSSLFSGAGSNEVMPDSKNENTHEEGFTYADQAVLDILQTPFVYGDRAHALTEPNTVVISKSKADKYFPGQNPVGRLLYLNNDKKPHKITGVMQNPPANSHYQFDFLLTQAGVEWWQGEESDWNDNNYTVLMQLRPGINIAAFEKKLTTDILRNYYLPIMQKSGDKDAEKELAAVSLHMQLVSDMHLDPSVQDGLQHGDMRFVWLFGAIAIFILIIACINFINLATAKSANRAKEVGVRKVVGSLRSSLIKQFLTESLSYSYVSFAIGISLAYLLLPWFNILSAKLLSIPWGAWWFVPVIVFSAAVVGFVAGLYPAVYLSSFKPMQVLKGHLNKSSKGSILRNGLVVFQFATSVILIISTMVIYSQMHFILNKKLGYNKNQVLLLQDANTLGDANIKNLKTALLKLPQVQSVSVGDYLPVAGTKRNGNTFWMAGKQNTEEGISCQRWVVDEDYLKTLGINMVEGRNFSPQMRSDSNAVVINQTMARMLNLKNPVGAQISNGYTYRVVGVVQDFNFESLRDEVGGLVLQLGNSPSIISVKMNTADVKGTIANISALWKSVSPGQAIRYTFLDESYANMYADVQRMASIFTTFAILAIIIACLGLFGLSAFMAEQRSKEIGIRKVLGASITGIAALMSKDFVKLVAIAIVVASPIAWWAMSKWLENFAYQTSISVWVFVLAGVAAILIALITVSFQSIKAALMNPVKSLKSE